MRKLAAAITAAALILAVPSALGLTPEEALHRDEARADIYWHSKPCGGGWIPITVSSAVPQWTTTDGISPSSGDSVLAWADWESAAGPENEGAPPATYTDCRVYLNAAEWPRSLIDGSQFLCDVVTHEIGHFLGHSDEGQKNPRLVTYPLITGANANSVPQCRPPRRVHRVR